MPGVLQVEALAQTMAVYVAQQEGFGDRIGLFAGIDECRFKRIVQPGDGLSLEVTMDKLGGRFGRGRGVASVDGERLLRGDASRSSSPREGVLALMAAALRRYSATSTATCWRSRRRSPTSSATGPIASLVAGDLVFNGPRPAETVERVRSARAGRRAGRPGQHRHRRGRLRLRAPRFRGWRTCPSATARRPSGRTSSFPTTQLEWLRGLPDERRLWADETLRAGVPRVAGQPDRQGLPTDLDPTVTVERVTRTDARVIACGHTHVADVRELGRKLIVNPGSCGYAFDGEPTANWALVTIPDQLDEDEADESPTGCPRRSSSGPTYDAQTRRRGGRRARPARATSIARRPSARGG